MASAAPHNPPFRAEQIGSFLRPPELLQAREDLKAGKISVEQLHQIEDQAIRDVVAFQERLGLESITDGEFRRETFFSAFYIQGLGGLQYDFATPGDWFFVDRKGHKIPMVNIKVTGRLHWKQPVHVNDFKFLSSLTDKAVKITLPSPTHIHCRAGRANISSEVYPDLDRFWDDIVEAFQKELKALDEAGCRYVQIDETTLPCLPDPHARATMAGRREDWRRLLLETYPAIMNRCFAGRPPAMHLAMHMCRGNNQGHWSSEGGYDIVADTLFNQIDVDSYFLEYDTPRAGSFEPLRFVPSNKTVVLGLVSTKFPELESKAALKQRIDEAAKFCPLDQLALSPQCGFASAYAGNPIPTEIEEAKLRLVIEVAREVWGS
ncbi:MAG TPA: 5-methyltetrahydropteroyltriglutamate--homocysteine S-methyltransferase [Candidatus Binataceae bacterium]|nr:5-methyltetrahydropteroyltriglutamate--homocysteine S-methyltransferase [Candidatus Binataceae bacterium]